MSNMMWSTEKRLHIRSRVCADLSEKDAEILQPSPARYELDELAKFSEQ